MQTMGTVLFCLSTGVQPALLGACAWIVADAEPEKGPASAGDEVGMAEGSVGPGAAPEPMEERSQGKDLAKLKDTERYAFAHPAAM